MGWGHNVTSKDAQHSIVAPTVTAGAASSVIPLTIRRTDTLVDLLTYVVTDGTGAGTSPGVTMIKGAPVATYQGRPVGAPLATGTA